MFKDKGNLVVFKNFSYLSMIQIGNVIIPLVVIPFVSRQISPESFGNLEFSRYFCFYFSVVINYSFNATTTRDIVAHRDNKTYINQIVSQTIYSKVFLFLISTIVFALLIFYDNNLTELSLLLFLTYLINLGFVLFPIWFFQGMEDMAKISIYSLIIRTIIGVLTIVLISDPADYWWYNFLQSIALISIGLAGFYLLIYKYKVKLVSFDYFFVLKLLKEGFPYFLSTFLITILGTMYYQFLKFYSTDIELGSFSTANKVIVSLNGLLVLPFAQAFFPMISKLANENIALFAKKINRTAWLLFGFTFLSAIFFYLLSDYIILLVFGAEYMKAVTPLKILAFLPIFTLLNNLYAFQGLMSLKKDVLFLYIHIFISIVALALTWYLKNNLSAESVSYIRLGIEVVLLIITYTAYRTTMVSLKMKGE